MLNRRHSLDRGHADHGWLKSHHSFSFAGYHDPEHMGWGNLRVINEDFIAPGKGFGTHGHRNMEIISYVVSGALAHQDSLGHGTSIQPGEVQRMSAGRGVSHCEFNHSQDTWTHFLQIWIMPSRLDLAPGYEQRTFATAHKRGVPCLIASPDGRQGSLGLHADAALYAALIDGSERVELALNPERKAYVQVVRGQVKVNSQLLHPGDAAQMADETQLTLSEGQDAEVLIFDLSA